MRPLAIVLLVAAGACTPPAPPGMATARARLAGQGDEIARVEPGPHQRALLVVYPRTSCSGSARIVLVDSSGHFLGAVAPGEAALLAIPEETAHVLAFSSVEVSAALGTWSTVEAVAIPRAPRQAGLLASTRHIDHRHCGTGQYAALATASKEQLEAALGASEMQWREPRLEEGQAWLDAHHARVQEVLATHEPREPR